MRSVLSKITAQAIGDNDDVVIGEIPIPNGGWVAMEIVPLVGALTNFRIDIKIHPEGTYLPYISGTDWATATAKYYASTSPAPHTCAAGSKAWVFFFVPRGVYVRVRASSDTALSTLALFIARDSTSRI